jgi:hypothetical protein
MGVTGCRTQQLLGAISGQITLPSFGQCISSFSFRFESRFLIRVVAKTPYYSYMFKPGVVMLKKTKFWPSERQNVHCQILPVTYLAKSLGVFILLYFCEKYLLGVVDDTF